MSAGGGAHGGAPVDAAAIRVNMPNNTGTVYVIRACGTLNVGDGVAKSEASTPPDCPHVHFEVEVSHNEGEVHVLANVGAINIGGATTAACMSNNVAYVVGAPPHEQA